MSSRTAPDPLLIADRPAFEALVTGWQREAVVGMDTEAASFHRFRDRVYLLQLSTPEQTVIVDPVGTGGLEPLRPWFDHGATQFIFHDADYDLRLMYREAGLRIRDLFDTRVAAQFLNLPGIGLGAILESRFGIRTDKRFQRADWSARPLTPDMLNYASTDTHNLPDLRIAFLGELDAIGRLAWVEEECRLLTAVEWPTQEPPEQTFLKIKGARDLNPRGLAVLRELHVWRDGVAGRLDRALFRVLGNEVLIALAGEPPRDLKGLERIRGIGPDNAARRGPEILEAIERGLTVPDADLPAFPRHPRYRPDPAFDVRVERLKTWRAALATRINLPPGLLAPNATLDGVARAVPTSPEELLLVPGIRRWQVGEFGKEVIALVSAKA